MTALLRPIILLCSLLFAVASSACGGSSAQPARVPEATPRPQHRAWRLAPTEPAYLFAIDDPALFHEWIETTARPYLELLARVEELEAQGVEAMEQLSGHVGDAVRILREMAPGATSTVQLVDALGIGAQSRLLLYGDHEMRPILRIELEKPQRFARVLERMAQLGGTRISRREHEGRPFYLTSSTTEQGFTFHFAYGIDGDGFVASMGGEALEADAGSMLFAEATDRSGFDRAALYAEAAERGFGTQVLGFMDTERLSTILSDDKLSDECEAESREAISIVPRLWAHGRRTKGGMETSLFVDLRDDYGSGLQSLLVKSPGFTMPDTKDSMGWLLMQLDLRKALLASIEKAKHIGKKPFECAQLQKLNAAFANLEQSFTPVLYTPFADTQSLMVLVKELELEGDELRSLHAFGLIGSTVADRLVSMMKLDPDAKVPDDLRPGEAPRPFFLPSLAEFGRTTLALGSAAVGISAGMDEELSKALTPGTARPGVLVELGMGREFWTLISERNEEELEDSEDPEYLVGVYDDTLREILLEQNGELIRPMFEWMVMSLEAKPNGLQLRMDIHMRESEKERGLVGGLEPIGVPAASDGA